MYDEAKLFSADAIKSAESDMRAVSFDHGLTLVIDTHPTLPPERKAEFLLSTATTEKDYQRARKDVQRLGVDPDSIPHRRPR